MTAARLHLLDSHISCAADLSKYGTIISPSGTFEEAPLSGASARVPPNCMLRFGFKSPFKLYHQARQRLACHVLR
jgi:hypothetical protein